MTKKLISIICILHLLCSLCACGSSETAELPAATPEVTAEPTPEPTPEPVVYNIRISELMGSNKSTLAYGNGFYDWLELYNYGSEDAELKGLYLSSDGDRWALPDISLKAGEYLIIFCSGDESKGEMHADLKISKEGCTLALERENGEVIHQIEAGAMESDYSLCIDDSGSAILSAYPSPGYGTYEEFQASRQLSSPLIISEVAVYNQQHPYKYGGFYDWIELKNISAETVMLSDYYISDSGSDFKEVQLPEIELGSGEYFVLWCDDESTSEGITPIALNAQEDQLYLAHKDSGLADYMLLRGIPYLGSCGRVDGENGSFYFTETSPGTANAAGVLTQADTPAALSADGVFNGVDSVMVELSGKGKIYYSLDGSLPDENSSLYEGPFSLDKTCVVRAVSIEEGKLNSKPLNLSYIINENHTLPVMSIASDPEELLGRGGLYKNPGEEMESYGAAMFYEEDGSFSIGCGIELHGLTSRIVAAKKSFNLQFRSRYDGRLQYDMFNNGVTEFSHIILHAPVESTNSSLMRDNLMHQLAQRNFPALPMQDYKYCALYVNGEYWGVYNLREAHGEDHYAQHYGIAEELVTHSKEKWLDEQFGQYYSYALGYDMSKDEHYEYVAKHMDVDSAIAWAIMEAYSGNIDAHSPNVRFYFREDTQQMIYALVDLDLGMEDYYAFAVPFNGGYCYNNLLARLMSNEQFVSRFTDELSRVLNGGMSDESVHALIDELAVQIAPEMERDAQRWGYSLYDWEKMVGRMHSYLDRMDGRAIFVAKDWADVAGLSKEEYQQFFGELE